MANKNRTLGHNAERYYVTEFRELGYEHCLTSRYGSRVHDDAGIDLINIPWNIQIKAGVQKGLNIRNTLKDIKERIKKMFPEDAPEHERPLILIHKRSSGKGKRRSDLDEIVYMTFQDFKKIIQK